MDESNQTGRVRFVFAIVLVVPITLIHFATDHHLVELHNVYRRLYYIPIVLGAFAAGMRGGLGVSIIATLGYLPHAFFAEHHDPAPAIDKLLEMVLYLAIGVLTGWLVEQQERVRKQLERALTERNALETQLVRAGKLSALGELSAGLAHEIRNPLASILGAAESFVGDLEPDHPKHRLGELLIKEVHRLNGVVTRFGSFARSEPMKRVTTNLMGLAADVVELTQAEAESRNIHVALRDECVEADVDPEQVRQVLLNVILNAFEASEGEANPRVLVVAETRDVASSRFHCIGVRDNGPGLPRGHEDDVFDPYFTTRDGGTGLGLSISSRIMEAHGGFIDFEEHGGETTAWLCFPEEIK